MFFQVDLSLLTKYRTQLMGIAMIWIIFTHSYFSTNIPILDFIKFIGYGGVDLFLLLSGIGIYFSFKKNTNTISFYKKRALRILPYYIPIPILTSVYWVVFDDYDISSIFYNVTTLSFWFNIHQTIGYYGFDWYLPSLLLFYFVSPFYMKLFKKKPYISSLIVISFGIIISLIISNTRLFYLLIFTTRIPIYFIGILIGYLIDKKKKLDFKSIVLLFISFLIGLISIYMIKKAFLFDNGYLLWSYGLLWYPFIFISLPALISFSYILSCFKNYSYPILSFLGKYTLVIYLLHERFIMVAKDSGFTDSLALMNIVVILATLAVGYFYQNGISKLLGQTK